MRFKTSLLCVLLLSLALIPGCTPEQVGKFKAAISSINDQRPAYEQMAADIEVKIQELDAYIAALPEGEERDKALAVRAEWVGKYLIAANWLDKADRTVGEYNALIAEADDVWDIAIATVQAGAEYVPAPWGKLILLGTSVLLGIRARKNRLIGREVARSVQPFVTAALVDSTEAAPILAKQSDAAKRLVDEAQGKKFSLPI